MKKSLYFFIFAVGLTFLFSSCTSSPPVDPAEANLTEASSQVKIMGFYEEWDLIAGVIENDIFKVFIYDEDLGWEEIPSSNLRLPLGYKDIFYMGDWYFGIIINDTVQIFEMNDDSEGTLYLLKSDYPGVALPHGYQQVFGLGMIAVVVDDVLRFYNLDGEIPDTGSNLPRGYTDIFCLGFDYERDTPIIGIVVNGEVMFCGFDYNGRFWAEYYENRFKLPSGYRGVTGFDTGCLGVLVGDTLKIYIFDEEWTEMPEMSLNLR